MNSDIKKYLSDIGRKGGYAGRGKKGFATFSREQIAEACRRSAETRRRKAENRKQEREKT